MGYVIIIPARLESSRLSRKLLRRVGDMPIIEHTWRRASQAGAERIIIATDAEEIAAKATAFGAECQMTDPALESGTARVCSAAEELGLPDDQLIINVQADEPLISPAHIDGLAKFAVKRSKAPIATLACPASSPAQAQEPGCVKVVCDGRQNALYFSRCPIPWQDGGGDYLIHIGLYAYSLEYLRRYTSYAPGPLEMGEGLEQLRALWYGDRIAVLPCKSPGHIGIDTIDDLKRFEEHWSQQALNSTVI